MDEKKEWKKKIDLPFIKVRENEEEEYVEIGPIVIHKKDGHERVSFFGDDMEKTKLAARLWTLSWALFLILVGVVLTLENATDMALDGVIWAGTGLILLGLNMARLLLKLKLSAFWSVVGLVLLAMGTGEMMGYDIPTLPLLLIAAGLWIIIKAFR